jgi:hypothetical protein
MAQEKTHTLTIAGLDDFEAEHIGQILHGYKVKVLVDMIKDMTKKDDAALQWHEEHLAWHEETMKKIKWKAEDVK